MTCYQECIHPITITIQFRLVEVTMMHTAVIVAANSLDAHESPGRQSLEDIWGPSESGPGLVSPIATDNVQGSFGCCPVPGASVQGSLGCHLGPGHHLGQPWMRSGAQGVIRGIRGIQGPRLVGHIGFLNHFKSFTGNL